MVKVASLAVDVLERTKSRLMALLNQGIAMETQEYGTEHFKAALEMNPATTPPKCIARLMNTCRREIEVRRRDIALEESLSHLNFLEFTECHALSDALKAGGEQSTLDKYTQIVLEELQSWRDPWITPEKLPSITARDVKLVEDWR